MSRRVFLSLVLGAGLAVAATAGGWAWLRGDPAAIIIAILQRRVGFLNPSPKVLEAFAGDYLKFRAGYRSTLMKLSLLAWPLARFSPYHLLKLRHPLRRLEDNVVSLFLLSTDFFDTGADEGRTPQYLGFQDPATTACRNPFATRPDVR